MTPIGLAMRRKMDLEAKKHSAEAEVAEISDSIEMVKGKTSELKRSAALSEAKVRETDNRIARVNAEIERLQKKADRKTAEEVMQSFIKKREENKKDPQSEDELREIVSRAAGTNFAEELLNQMIAYRLAKEQKYRKELDVVQKQRTQIRKKGDELRELTNANAELENEQMKVAHRSALRKRSRGPAGDPAAPPEEDSQLRVSYQTRTRQRQ